MKTTSKNGKKKAKAKKRCLPSGPSRRWHPRHPKDGREKLTMTEQRANEIGNRVEEMVLRKFDPNYSFSLFKRRRRCDQASPHPALKGSRIFPHVVEIF